MLHRMHVVRLAALLLALSGTMGGCKKSQPRPERGERETYYGLLPVNARYGTARNTLQLVSDTVDLTLDGATIRGIDAVADMWKRLWAGANLTSVARTVLLEQTPAPGWIRDSGIVVFSRRAAADTTMEFAAKWYHEKEGWRLISDSIWAKKK